MVDVVKLRNMNHMQVNDLNVLMCCCFYCKESIGFIIP